MSRRFVIAALLASSLLAARGSAPAAEEEKPAAPDQAAAPAAEAAPAEPAPEKFSADRLDQLVGPIALYPDPLLIQVLIGSTYPLEIVEADRWRSKNKDLKGDDLTKALEQQDWDPSVEGLTQFPDLLKRMSDNLDWTKDLGDAFLGQKDDVLDAVQRMRKLAQTAGALQTTKEQTVTKEVVSNKETIVIEPADPQTVYVPQYPPTAYGPPPAQPYYPTSYGYPPGYAYPGYTGGEMAMASLLSFGVGVGVGALISDGCDWDDHDVYVNNNYGGGGGGKNQNVNVNVDRERNVDRSKTKIDTGNRGQQKWQHDPEHRRNVGYRDPGTAKRFEGQNTAAARQRQAKDAARGFNGGAAATRPATPSQRPASSAAPGGQRGDGERANADRGGRAPERGGGGERPAARPASAHGGDRDGAFGGYGDAGSTRAASQRGAQSRGGQSWAGSGGGGRGGSGRGGGGGGGHRGAGGGGRGGGGRGGGRR